MGLARALRLCVPARRVRSTQGSQDELTRNTKHESTLMRPICMVGDECQVQIDEAASTRVDASRASDASEYIFDSTISTLNSTLNSLP